MYSTGSFGNPVNGFSVVWNKYRPSILKMMLASENEPQEYKFYGHELKGLNTSIKTFSFTVQVVDSRIANSTKAPVIAKELFSMLQLSPKATELMKSSNFEFKLDSKFLFHISRLAPASE